jgi:hypothetical protein
MVTAIKQNVTVEAGGRIAVQSAELREGESAEVIIIVDRASSTLTRDRLDALQLLRSSLHLTSETANQWEADVRAERDARHKPAGQ